MGGELELCGQLQQIQGAQFHGRVCRQVKGGEQRRSEVAYIYLYYSSSNHIYVLHSILAALLSASKGSLTLVSGTSLSLLLLLLPVTGYCITIVRNGDAKMTFLMMLEFSTFSRQVEAEAKVPNYQFTEESRERHHFFSCSKLAVGFELFSCAESVFATHWTLYFFAILNFGQSLVRRL